ncbi:heterokaryon incompatibility protein-domain-containing protein, partial [Rhexocercosporidium sp. MPI-PUGE-AT-0058]
LRLIQTSTLRLESFLPGQIPEYAILSHTWTDGHEISYEEMESIVLNTSHSARNKFGYSKIVKTCEVARELGLDYIWVDTCCIKKSSSAELSEAINSMFQWYENAEVCIAYLADLPPTSNLENRMSRCKWFTRGWCLQELIAPRNVRFYNCRWIYIGAKVDSNLLSLVARISGIDERVLVDASSLTNISVAKKMSWAASRETTKPEDLAYCLMGIFDVNMPLLYGEGSKAFLRLQEEIIKRSNDLSIFAWG